jgi:hypothetical protein
MLFTLLFCRNPFLHRYMCISICYKGFFVGDNAVSIRIVRPGAQLAKGSAVTNAAAEAALPASAVASEGVGDLMGDLDDEEGEDGEGECEGAGSSAAADRGGDGAVHRGKVMNECLWSVFAGRRACSPCGCHVWLLASCCEKWGFRLPRNFLPHCRALFYNFVVL